MPEKITRAVIAAAGLGTRMWPASKVVPKELFPLGRIPVIAHLVWEFADAGIRDVVIVASAQNRAILEDLFNSSVGAPAGQADQPVVRRFQESLSRCTISILEQNEKAGYGNAIPLRTAANEFGPRPCVYAFGDDVVIGENATASLIETYERTGNPVMAAQEVDEDRKQSFGILECEKRDDQIEYVRRIIEKPKPQETDSNLASFGRYLVTAEVVEAVLDIGSGRSGEVWFVDAITRQLQRGQDVCALKLTTGVWYTVGDPKSFAEAVAAATREQLCMAEAVRL